MYQCRHAILVSNCALLIALLGCAGGSPATSDVTPAAAAGTEPTVPAVAAVPAVPGIDGGVAEDRAEPAATAATPALAPDALVDITALDSTIRIDIRYAGSNNFTGVAVYPVARCLLRRAVAERLVRVQRALIDRGLGLLIWDCYRPISVQERFWQLVPDARYVARPVIEGGVPVRGSKHNRGAAVDLTLVDASGVQRAMPTEYDDFSTRAHRGARGVPAPAAANALLLERAMAAEGFIPLPTEWWHFDGPGWQQYPLADVPLQAP